MLYSDHCMIGFLQLYPRESSDGMVTHRSCMHRAVQSLAATSDSTGSGQQLYELVLRGRAVAPPVTVLASRPSMNGAVVVTNAINKRPIRSLLLTFVNAYVMRTGTAVQLYRQVPRYVQAPS